MKKLLSFLYWHLLRKPLHKAETLRHTIEKEYLGYCTHGCQNCYKWRCSLRDKGLTPFKKYRD